MDLNLAKSRLKSIKEDSKRVYLNEDVLNFGKYKGTGKTLKQIIRIDAKYLHWLIHNADWFKVQPHIEKKIEKKYWEEEENSMDAETDALYAEAWDLNNG